MTTLYVLAWLRAFAFTEVVEAPMYRRALGVSWRAALGASAITHPFVWFVFPRLGCSWLVRTAAAEVFAWLAEALWFYALSRRGSSVPITLSRAVLTSLVVNAASEGLGLLSRALFGGP